MIYAPTKWGVPMKAILTLLLVLAAAGVAHAQSAKAPPDTTAETLPVYTDPQPSKDGLPLVPKPGQSPITASDSITPYQSGSYQQDKFIDPMIVDPSANFSDLPENWKLKTKP
jgi:hypothetical protein